MSPADMIAGSAVAAVLSDPRLPDNPIIECNQAFLALTGYAREEIIGRNCRFLVGPGTEPRLTEALRAGLREKRVAMAEILNYRKDGTPFRNAVMIAPIFGEDGEVRYFLGSQVEVTSPPTVAADRADLARRRMAALSQRQLDVQIAMAAGKLNKQIAHELGLTERTVKMHRAAMLRALGIRTSAEAIRIAIEAGY